VFHAFRWENGAMTDLGTVDGDLCSTSENANSKGQIVGASQVAPCGPYSHAFLWENGGPSVDLNALIPPNSPLQLTVASLITENGEIVAVGDPAGCTDNDSCSHSYVLIPCDENHPGTAECDYSLVDAAAATRESPEASFETPPIPDQNKSVRQLLRRRIGPPSGVSHPMTGAVDDPKTPISQNSDWPLENSRMVLLNAGSDSRAHASQNSCPAAHCTYPTHSESCGACSCPFPHHGVGFLGYDSVHHHNCTVCVCT
jgi:probable HAF family extracellular repeat protein